MSAEAVRLYAESSAIVAWLLGEANGDDIRGHLSGAEEILTSVLTLVESDRVLIRAQLVEGLGEGEVADRRRTLARASRHWHLLQLHGEIWTLLVARPLATPSAPWARCIWPKHSPLVPTFPN